MLSPKIAALCLCPVVAGPVVLATQPKARHAVAHILHHAASKLDGPVAVAAEPVGHCPASYASEAPGSGLTSGTPTGITSLTPQDLSALSALTGSAGSSGGEAFRPFSNLTPGSGIGGSSSNSSTPPGGGGGGTPSINAPLPPDGVTEPQNWALLMTGFALAGLAIRRKRPKPA